MRIIPVLITISSLAFLAEARDVSFSYYSDDLPIHGYGHPHPDSYDVCIRIDDPVLTGGYVKSFSVPIPQSEGCSINPDVQAWVVNSLESEPISASNSLAFVNTISDGNSIEVVFPEGVKIPEEGLYVGYTVTVKENPDGLRTYPIAVVDGSVSGSLYFRSTTLSRWDNTYYRMEYMSPMKVNISVDLPDYGVLPSLPEKMRVKRAADCGVILTYTNLSIEPIHSIKYRLSTTEFDEFREIEISSQENKEFGASSSIRIPFLAPSELGDSHLTLEITEVNGHPNITVPMPKAEMGLRVLPDIPKYRPLVEEYTGLWCGNCPSGWVALEEAREQFGDDFVFMTYHVNDILTPNLQQPMSPRSVPALTIDRESYLGASELEKALTDHFERQTDVDLQVKISWEGDNQQALKATAITTFMEPRKGADYSVAMYLVADKLSDQSWGQANFFSGQRGKTGKYWDIFTYGGAYIFGLNYDGVATVCYNPLGKYGNIPDLIYEFESFDTTEIFSLADGISMRGVDLIRDPDNLRVVAILIDNLTGGIVNSATSIPTSHISEQEESDSVDYIESSHADINYEKYFSLEGQRLETPLPCCPVIRVRYYSDSSVEVSKIIY